MTGIVPGAWRGCARDIDKKGFMKTVIAMMAAVALARMAGAEVSFSAAEPVWPRGEEKAMNTFFRFRTEFEAAAGAKAVLRITAGYDYKAWLNGAFAGFGPARCAPGSFRVDEWPLAAKGGRNVVEVDSAGYNCNNFYLPQQTPFLQAEVVVDGRVVARTAADGDFTAHSTGRVRKAPRFCYQRTFAEIYRLPHAATALPLAAQAARTLLPREWDVPDFALTAPFEARSAETVAPDADAKPSIPRFISSPHANYRQYRADELEENPYFDIQRLKTVRRTAPPAARDGGWYPLRADEGIVFAGSGERAGFPLLRARCAGPVTVYLTFDEMLAEDGSVNPLRTDTVGTLVWHLGAGEYELEGFEPIAFNCARVLAVGGAAEITAPRIRTYESPSAAKASFRASDPGLARIFNAARRSYAANAVDCLTDCPIRERAGWLGDTFFTGRASRWLTGSARNEGLFLDNFLRPKDYIGATGVSEAPFSAEKYRGLVPAVWPVDLMCDACFIPNWDFWFVLELEEFAQRGGDEAFVRAFRPRVEEILAWFARHLNSDGLLEKLPGWVFVEWSQANRLVQDVNYPSNMMYAKMLDAIARLYARPELAAQAAKVRAEVRRQALVPGGWFCDNAVRQADGTLRLSGERTEVCQYYAFFTGTATKERDAALWRRLVDDFGPNRAKKGLWKEIWPANFIFGTCLRMELLSLDGRGAQIYRELRDYFLEMADRTGTLWEHNDARASCCHGFASIASEYLYRDMLGVKAVDGRTKTVRLRVAPDMPLEWCEGDVPVSATETAFVRWERRGGRPVVETRLPAGWKTAE